MGPGYLLNKALERTVSLIFPPEGASGKISGRIFLSEFKYLQGDNQTALFNCGFYVLIKEITQD